MLGPMLASIHNLHYYLNLMREIREALRSIDSVQSERIQVRSLD